MARKRSYRTRARRYAGRARRGFGRRAAKMSLTDYASLAPGAVHTVGQMGGLENAIENPKNTAGLLMENYFGYDPVKGNFSPKAAWENQWKPFLVIQGGKRLIGAFFPKLKRFRLFGKKVL